MALLGGQAQEVCQELQPSRARVGRLKELVARVSGDLSSLEKQVEQTDVKFGLPCYLPAAMKPAMSHMAGFMAAGKVWLAHMAERPTATY